MQARLAALISAFVLAISCKRDEPIVEPPPPNRGIEGISVSPTTATLAVGETARFSAVVMGHVCSAPCVQWRSSDTLVAWVRPDSGIVTARAPGHATIMAQATFDSSFRAATQVTVTP